MQKSTTNNNHKNAFQELDTTLKVPSLFFLMMSMAFFRNQNLMLLLPCIAVIMFAVSGIKVSLLVSRFRAPMILLLSVSIFLILFSQGETFFKIGPFALKTTGILLAFNTILRVLSIITIGVIMVQTTSLAGLSGKLKKIMIPKMLVDMGILTGRYIMVIGDDFSKMRNARKLRGYVTGKSISKRLQIIVPTVATLLIRGFQQSEMAFNAMHLRGYGNISSDTNRDNTIKKPHGLSLIVLLCTLVLSSLLIVLEIILESA